MDRVRWGMIGCGNVTEGKSGPAFHKIEGSELVAVMCRHGGRARDYAQRHGVAKWYNDADKLIHAPEVNAVYVATPPGSHADYTLRAAAAGKPVYVEKPMACRHAECRRMIDACEKAGVPLFVAYYRRCLATFLKVKELVDGGAIGDVRFVSVTYCRPPEPRDFDEGNPPWRVLPQISGGGYFVDMASHQLDFLDYLFGPIVSVQGRAANQAGLYRAEDIVSAHFAFDNGVAGNGLWCFTVSEAGRIDHTEIVGTAGRISFSTFDDTPVRFETPRRVEEFSLPWPAHVQQPLIETVVGELLGRGRCPSTGFTAARTDWVIDQVLDRI